MITSSRSKTTEKLSKTRSPASTTRLFPPPHKATFSGHGRTPVQTIWVSSQLAGYSDFPHLEQVFRIDRLTRDKKTGRTRQESVFGVTSLSAQKASPRDILDFVRGHWEIENRLHWVRDTAYREDTCTTRTGNGAHVMATLRNMAISLLRVAGSPSIAPVLDRFSNKPSRIFRFLGL
ncbi:MAG: ISAs1 family transposase [Nitrospiraceae bacterium]|nr:ISAs1 family transposase [Nitrospiraceae bacterium]